MKKYSKLYNDIKEQIITGQLSHGDKILSIRKIKLKIQKKVKLKSNIIFAANRQTLKALMYRSGKDILKMRLDKKTDC